MSIYAHKSHVLSQLMPAYTIQKVSPLYYIIYIVFYHIALQAVHCTFNLRSALIISVASLF